MMKDVTAAILIKDNKILIARRKASDSQGGKWEFPGGTIKEGETPRHCLIREMKEEFGIKVSVGNFYGCFLVIFERNYCILTCRSFYYKLIFTMSKKILIITAALLGFAILSASAIAGDKKQLTKEEKARQKSLEKDAFYSARIRLNVWRSTSIEAGTFDQAQYDEFRFQLYEKSVNDSLICYEEFILEENFYDANICLQTWRMHSKELGTYDKDQYEALKERLKLERIKKA
ncbi:MAG: NUDIX domain-containing protein, partial [Desulfobacterales bacterium]